MLRAVWWSGRGGSQCEEGWESTDRQQVEKLFLENGLCCCNEERNRSSYRVTWNGGYFWDGKVTNTLNAKESVERELKEGRGDWWNQFLEEVGRKWAPGPWIRGRRALWPLCYIAQWLSSRSIGRWSGFEKCIIRMAWLFSSYLT